MSFGYSIGDAVLLTQLAWKTVQNARKACGEHDELTREALSLHVVLRRLEQEVEKPGIPISDVYKEELEVILGGCEQVLSVFDQVLTKYNALSEQERSIRKLCQKVRFGNGKITDLATMRSKLTYYTSAMSLFVNMVSMGTMGRVERQMNDAGGDLKDIKLAVNSITAHLMLSSDRHEGSVLTAYADDDRAVWKEFRRELVGDGFSSSVIRKHKRLIKAYIEELGSRGLFDEEDSKDDAEEQSHEVDLVVEGNMTDDPMTESSSDASPRPKVEVDLPLESTSPLEFDSESNAASPLENESRDNERPTDDPVSRVDSQPEPKAELRWAWLYSESNGESQQSQQASAEKYEEMTCLFHDMWHDYHDNIAPRCLESIPWKRELCKYEWVWEQPMSSKFEKTLTTMRKELWRLTLLGDLLVAQKELLGDMNTMQLVLRFPLAIRTWKGQRPKVNGYRMIVETTITCDAIHLFISTGARCALCPTS